ncbi:MAG TPA: hypothetical protein VJN44_16690 [Roseateles sp.]|nr:hypothetical protein [Roseateles sp.]
MPNLVRSKNMPMRRAVLLILFASCSAARAIQPVAPGLRPLLDRQQAIASEQQLLNQRLQSAATHPEERAAAHRAYAAIELERRQLECEIEQARRRAASPLVSHAAPAKQGSCPAPV